MKRFLNLICAFILIVCCSSMTACSNSIVGTYELVGIKYWDVDKQHEYNYQVGDGIKPFFEKLNSIEPTITFEDEDFEIPKNETITQNDLVLNLNDDGTADLEIFNEYYSSSSWRYDSSSKLIRVELYGSRYSFQNLNKEHWDAGLDTEEGYYLKIDKFYFCVKKVDENSDSIDGTYKLFKISYTDNLNYQYKYIVGEDNAGLEGYFGEINSLNYPFMFWEISQRTELSKDDLTLKLNYDGTADLNIFDIRFGSIDCIWMYSYDNRIKVIPNNKGSFTGPSHEMKYSSEVIYNFDLEEYSEEQNYYCVTIEGFKFYIKKTN